LLYLNVKLVPLFAFLLLGRKITLDVWLYAFMAFTGTALLSFDGSPPNIGDLWSILAAAASAMFILRLEGAAAAYSATRSKELNSATLWVTTGLCGLWATIELVRGGGVHLEVLQDVVEQDWRQILYLGVITTAICNWIQTIGQREVPAEKAALIYAMDPVYGAVFARLLLGDSEILGVQGIVGAALVTGSAVASTLLSNNRSTSRNEEEDGGGSQEMVGSSRADEEAA
jgi:drug/metabolite transporter (DMT)-like permease